LFAQCLDRKLLFQTATIPQWRTSFFSKAITHFLSSLSNCISISGQRKKAALNVIIRYKKNEKLMKQNMTCCAERMMNVSDIYHLIHGLNKWEQHFKKVMKS
jgi:hypothetical protein